ncbi:hydrogenase small subunit [Acetobacterium sp.]|uniref:hydrogenase small subunit n=1 Tax=Acetobacterium sp. TaxID=1872094 RepID=UPI002F3FACB6
MKISRRDFLKWSVAAGVALNVNFDLADVNSVLAAETDPPIIWIQGAGCSGCTISTLNVTNPATIDDVLLNKVSMKYNNTIMASSGSGAVQALEESATQYNGQFILVVEGAVPTGASGNYCVIGELNGVPLTVQQAVLKYGPMAKYVVAAGTCASFGGVSAAGTNETGCSGVNTLLTGKTINPVVNLSGCPVHPTVMIQSLLDLILVGKPAVDSNNRPTKYFSETIHSTCPRREEDDASQIGATSGCFEALGCMGKSCQNVCESMKWNNGQAWCIGVNYPCIGCSDPTFPANPLLIGSD